MPKGHHDERTINWFFELLIVALFLVGYGLYQANLGVMIGGVLAVGGVFLFLGPSYFRDLHSRKKKPPRY